VLLVDVRRAHTRDIAGGTGGDDLGVPCWRAGSVGRRAGTGLKIDVCLLCWAAEQQMHQVLPLGV
jgi:hypothetical protein